MNRPDLRAIELPLALEDDAGIIQSHGCDNAADS